MSLDGSEFITISGLEVDKKEPRPKTPSFAQKVKLRLERLGQLSNDLKKNVAEFRFAQRRISWTRVDC